MGEDSRHTAVKDLEKRIDWNGADGVNGNITDKSRKVPDVLDSDIFLLV